MKNMTNYFATCIYLVINPKYYRFRVTYHDKYGKINYYTSNVIVNRKHNITKLT